MTTVLTEHTVLDIARCSAAKSKPVFARKLTMGYLHSSELDPSCSKVGHKGTNTELVQMFAFGEPCWPGYTLSYT